MLNYDEVKERYKEIRKFLAKQSGLEVAEIEEKVSELARSNCEALERVKDLKNIIDKMLEQVHEEVLNGG